MARNELKHWGIKGMRWGRRKAEVRTPGPSGFHRPNQNQNQPQHQNLSRKQRRQRAIDRAKSKPYRQINQLDKRFTFKNVVAGLAVGAAGMVITRLAAPTVDIFGQKIRSGVESKLALATAKRVARKNFESDKAAFMALRAASMAVNNGGNLSAAGWMGYTK